MPTSQPRRSSGARVYGKEGKMFCKLIHQVSGGETMMLQTDWQSGTVHEEGMRTIQLVMPDLIISLSGVTPEQWEGVKLYLRDIYRAGYRAGQEAQHA